MTARRPTHPTPRQLECFGFIQGYIEKNGCSPKLTEIAEALGGLSKGNVHSLLTELKRHGVLTWTHHKQRSIRILNSAASHEPPTAQVAAERAVSDPSVADGAIHSVAPRSSPVKATDGIGLRKPVRTNGDALRNPPLDVNAEADLPQPSGEAAE